MIGLLAVLRVFATEPVKKAFNLTVAAAEDGLAAFAQQSGVELVFNVEHVQGVRTKAVRGLYAPREALERLLAGTPLVVVQDAATGAFFVNRRPPPAPGAKNSRRPPAPAGRAKAAGDKTASSDGDAVVLNPFLVETNRDRGYVASTTLAGTRLNTPLRDIGASVSVYTKGFLSDIGAANHHDLVVYATGMEAGGPGGNFSNGANDINDPQVVGDGARVSPQTQWRTRGLAAPNATRGFFVSDLAGDAYNTEAITVSRGPNAMLFGVGSPTGVVDTALIRPDLAANANRVEARYGDNDSLRRVADFNRVLIPQVLGFRVAVLDDHERFEQRPAFEAKRRLFGAAAFEPWRATAVRMNFETGYTRANRPFQVMPFRSLSTQWE